MALTAKEIFIELFDWRMPQPEHIETVGLALLPQKTGSVKVDLALGLVPWIDLRLIDILLVADHLLLVIRDLILSSKRELRVRLVSWLTLRLVHQQLAHQHILLRNFHVVDQRWNLCYYVFLLVICNKRTPLRFLIWARILRLLRAWLTFHFLQ